MNDSKTIQSDDLIDLTPLSADGLVRIDLAYARDDNLLFGEQIYRADARMHAHKMLAGIVREAAERARDAGYRIILYDALRTTDAQAKMLETQAVRDNSHWLEEPRLLSPPGAGAHPRGMAIDCSLETLEGALMDMGTPFDYLATDPSPAQNKAHRAHPDLTDGIVENRALLDGFMIDASQSCGTDLLLLPQEWWDFRLFPEIYEQYAPLSDADLRPEMRCL